MLEPALREKTRHPSIISLTGGSEKNFAVGTAPFGTSGITLSPTLHYFLIWHGFPHGVLVVGIYSPNMEDWLGRIIKTLPRDCRGAYRFAHVLLQLREAQKYNLTVGRLFDRTVSRHPDKPFFLFEDRMMTFKEVQNKSNKIGNYFSSLGLKKGDSVSLFMENCPEYVCTWLGLSKIGVIPALINYNLRRYPLQHSFNVVSPKAVIFGNELSDALKEVLEMGSLADVPLFCFGHGSKPKLEAARDVEQDLTNSSPDEPTPSETVNFTDSLFYIYTSGTTGLPKAAIIKHFRFFMMVAGAHFMSTCGKNDVLYTTLPLYHSMGGMVGAGIPLFYGASLALRKKFSASNFWTDCIRYRATAAQYIGEVCRFLLNQPQRPEEQNHQLRLMLGNGLRHEIWEEFTRRFNIPQIAEIYGSTEGNCNFVNIDSHVGAVGFIPRIAYPFLPMKMIKLDENGEPLRDPKTGLAVKCGPNEAGELVGKIIRNHPIRDFQGYADSSSTKRKIIYDVFRKGDQGFRTGDILIMDELGYFYFKDRTGDTFRWKGENVSTVEVETIISKVFGFEDVTAYGVKVPGAEGRAGMIALTVPESSVDFDTLSKEISKALPIYARPLFVRFVKQIDMTGTYKIKKTTLQDEGFDITTVQDKIYFFNGNTFVPLDEDLFKKINSQEIRI
ncbi:unnamed protein product [Allacma fusca]|uniref:Very long-chain fatty acid transport protein n=1 Tax=Allacma fusca TaxID=39272 RepID=A0A8J2JRH5_9HEXA|nr:unnamed protein product [Allacma fusca]